MKNNQNILIFGHSSYLNKGCEAIVSTITKDIKQGNPSNNVVVATFDIDNDKKYLSNFVDRYVSHNIKTSPAELKKFKNEGGDNVDLLYQRDVLNEIPNSDICLSVGGDNYCYSGQLNFLATIDERVKAERKKLVLYGASIDESFITPALVKDLRKFDVILVRESITKSLLEKFVDSNKLIMGPDTAFALEQQEVMLPLGFLCDEGVVGINLSPLIMDYQEKNTDVLAAVKGLVDYILDNYRYKVALIPHVYVTGGNDLDTLRKLKSLYLGNDRVLLLDEKTYNSGELKYIISKCRFLIAARTHASIAGYSSSVPTLVLGYSVKSKGIAKDIFGDYENYVLPVQQGFNQEKLIDRFEFLIKNESKIKGLLESKMPKYKEKAGKLFELVLETIDNLDKINVTKIEKCSGCSACVNSCSKGAIKMKPDEEGFLFPVINQDACIDCGICRKICPNNNKYEYNYKDFSVIACKNLSENERQKSSSGGVFVLLARTIIQSGGCVFGASYTSDYNDVKHVMIDSENDLGTLMGSKYVESTIGDSYILAKSKLENGKEVLFTGTPCQIEGLRGYLGKDYANLYCISVFCHGVPSKKVYSKYLEELNAEFGDKLTNVNFRNKSRGWKQYKTEYTFGLKSVKNEAIDDLYMIGFLKDYYLRQSCYDCDYKLGKKNTSDIILGDLWGVEVFDKQIDDNKGLSAVVINSLKGRDLMSKIEKKIFSKVLDQNNVIKYNPGLVETNEINFNRFNFFNIFNKMGASFSVSYFSKIDKIQELTNDLGLNMEELQKKKQELEEANIIISTKEKILFEVLNSRRWRLITTFSDIFNKTFPNKSIRRIFVLRVGRTVGGLFTKTKK